MKIAFVDNMNNNFFAFARYLRDLGLDADVYVIPNSNMKHFEIVSDTFVNTKELKFVKNFPCDIKNLTWFLFQRKKIYNQFLDYDLIISCGLSSAYLERAGIFSDVVIPYGSDLYDVPFRKYKFELSLNSIRSFFWNQQSKYQIKAYKKARVIVSDDGYELYDTALKKLNLECLVLGIPMLYNFENINNSINERIWSFLDQYDFVVFNHSRQHWKSFNVGLKNFDEFGGLKRNDKLINAFAKYVKCSTFKRPILILFEYGSDVGKTKELIKELKIEKFVKWMPIMDRKNIMFGLSKGTFSTNAFRENITDIGGVCYESLAAGISHLNNCIEAIENPKHKFYQSPMIHVLSEDDILNVFLDYEQNPKKYKEIGQKSKEWFDENLGLGLAQKYAELIKLLVKDRTLTQNEKIVREIFEN